MLETNLTDQERSSWLKALEKENPKQPAPSPDLEFDIFWKHYPRKTAKKQAVKAWGQKFNLPMGPFLEVIIKALLAQIEYAETMDSLGEWTPDWPYPATWLNGERWNDKVKEIDWEKYKMRRRAKRMR